MRKKYLMTMLAVAVSAGMMFTGCGNKSEEVTQSTQEIQTEVADYKPESLDEAVEGEDYLSANGIEISPKVTEEN